MDHGDAHKPRLSCQHFRKAGQLGNDQRKQGNGCAYDIEQQMGPCGLPGPALAAQRGQKYRQTGADVLPQHHGDGHGIAYLSPY